MINQDEFDLIVKSNVLNPSITQLEIEDSLNRTTSQSKTLPKIVIEFNNTVSFGVVKEIDDLLKNYSTFIVVKKNDEVKEYISMSNSVSTLETTEIY